MYPSSRRSSRGRRRHRRRQRRGPAVHDHRQRRDRESRRVFPGDAGRGPARPADRGPNATCRSSTSSIRPASSCRCRMRFSRRRRFRPHLPQQRGDLGGGRAAVRGDHGQLRRRRRLSAGAVRQAADDRGQRPLSRRAGAGEGRDRPDGRRAKSSAARRCTPRSAAPSTSANRTTRRAWSGCGRWSICSRSRRAARS